MAKLNVETPIKPVISKTKKRKDKPKKSKLNDIKTSIIKEAVKTEKNKEKDVQKKYESESASNENIEIIKPILKVKKSKEKLQKFEVNDVKTIIPAVKAKKDADNVKKDVNGEEKGLENKNETAAKENVDTIKPVVSKTKKNKKKLKKVKVNDTNTSIMENSTGTEKKEVNNVKIDGKGEEKVNSTTKEDFNIVRNKPDKELMERYNVFKNEGFVNKFLSVTLTNNQKGRIRQQLKGSLKDTSEQILPDVIHNLIKTQAKNSDKLTDSELRRIRLLYNMLRLAIQNEKSKPGKVQKKKKNKKSKKKQEKGESFDVKEDLETKETDISVDKENPKPDVKKEENSDSKTDKMSKDKKAKAPKRYVVFVGNLPLDVDKEKIMTHFSEVEEQIVDVRIPPPAEGKKAAIAYVELKNAPSYELALSKHHSMMSSKRINVLFTAQKNSKLTKTEAKGKAAKLIALQSSGKLTGIGPLNSKRGERRKKAKLAQKQLQSDE